MKRKECKIGEIYIFIDTDNSNTESSVGFLFNDKLTSDISKEKNKDLKDRMVNILNELHALLVDIQRREAEECFTCSVCGCEVAEEELTTCCKCGEEFCPSCESWENPEMCDSCELELQDGEEF